ncbi:hypothetical protein MPTK1_1g29300 [Marchantia polymorpha subsp. ruderalis]|uniref:Uncharacterized protein n=2 Tax=Marchantia polymorpha TaxID=3197 RepID=A0AAF6AVH9_MARPO|nr:hypothetical protein MARPO_0107s0045 [Marchantia polymorpha]BBN00450.1 hypothetical protein Mp_1g29300 [Marchantia polymorpha subsp. ruderalis]|eukprot:PTQ31778.1 hypothetical protein MARPO_0107s0045 [Marchantia polymorpha]
MSRSCHLARSLVGSNSRWREVSGGERDGRRAKDEEKCRSQLLRSWDISLDQQIGVKLFGLKMTAIFSRLPLRLGTMVHKDSVE